MVPPAREGVWLKSPAKVNLSLRVLGLRSDGYHEIETWMQQVDLFDRIWISPGGRGIRVTTNSHVIPAGRSNLVYQAAAALRESVSNPSLGARIHLEKTIPAGAGLGGGSGNAATVLWALNRLWGLNLSSVSVFRLAAKIGSDIPFFLGGTAALCQGKGDLVFRRDPIRRGYFLLVKPPYSLPTPEVYRWMRKKLKNGMIPSRIGPRSMRLHPTDFGNDLEQVVFPRYPRLKACRDLLISLGANRALMSGSGPTLWSFFNRMRDVEIALDRLRRQRGWMVRVARPLACSMLSPKFLKNSEFAPLGPPR